MIITKQDQEDNAKILVPDEQIHFDGDISNLVGHVFIKNTKKVPIEFNEEIFNKLKHNDERFKNEKSVALTYADLTKKHFGKTEGLIKWTIPDEEKDTSKPAGCYIASTFPENTYVKTTPRQATYLRYAEPLLDIWTRQLNQPTMVNTSLYQVKLATLKKRHYQTNIVKEHAPFEFKFIDFMTYIFQCYLKKDYNKCLDYLRQLAKSIFKTNSPIEMMFFTNAFIFSALTYFEHLQNELENKQNNQTLSKQIETDAEISKKATLYNLYKFTSKVLTNKIEQSKYSKILESYGLKPLNNSNDITTFTLFVLLKQSLTKNKDNPGVDIAQLLMNMGQPELSDAMFFKMYDIFKNFCATQTSDMYSPLIVNPINIAVGKQIIFKLDNLDKDYFYTLTDGRNTIKTSFYQDMLVFNVNNLDLNKNSFNCLTLKKENNKESVILAQLNLSDENYKLPNNIKLVTTNIHENFKPIYLQLYPFMYTTYTNFVIDMLYNGISQENYLNNSDAKPFRSTKYLLDLGRLANMNIHLDNLPTYLAAGLGQRIEFTLIDDNNYAQEYGLDMIHANAIQINMDQGFDFKVENGDYSQYSNMPYWSLYEYQLKHNKHTQYQKATLGKNRIDRLFEKLIKEALN